MLLAELGVPVGVVRDYLNGYLDRDPPPSFNVVVQPDGNREIYRYGMVDLIEGRAMVLAATPQAHPVDAVDLYVSALFDPKSLTTFATAAVGGVDPTRLVEELAVRLSRYGGVRFPPARVATLGTLVRISWSSRDQVVRVLRAAVGSDVFWTYTKIGDQMVLSAETEAVIVPLRAAGLINGGSPVEPEG